MQVLVVSESAVERLRATSALRLRADVEVLEADTAARAQQILAERQVDVLVMDGDLAPQGGFSVLYELRAAADLDDALTPPTVIMLGRDDDRWLAGWAGANETMLKPVNPFRLADLVHDLAGTEPAERVGVAVSDQQAADAVERTGTGGLTPESGPMESGPMESGPMEPGPVGGGPAP